MMTHEQGIIEVTPPHYSLFDDYLERLMEKNICYQAGNLKSTGFNIPEDVKEAVSKAMLIMGQNGFPLRQHFKKIYVWDETTGEVLEDWKLSQLAMVLTVLNGPKENPFVGQTQLALLKRYFDV